MEAFKPSDILSKHFLYKPHLILYSKCFLTIGRSGLILDSLPFQFDQREYIRFDDLLYIHSSEKKALCREFSLRVDKKTSSSLLTFVSYDRTSLLMSLYKAFDLYIYENRKETHIIYPELIEFSGLFLDSFNEGKKGIEEVKVVLFRTSLLVFFQNWNDNIEGFNSLDILSRESLATSFKEEKSFFSHKTIWLDYDKLKGIRRTASGVIFFTKTSKIGFNFLTYDSEKTNILIETVQKRVFLHLESKLESFEDEIPIKIDKENASELLLSQYCLVNAEKLSFSGIKRSKIILALSEAYLTEINPENKQILNKWPLKMITYLIRHEFDFYGLELLDQDDIQARYILCSSKRDIFLNNIIHLMNSKTNNNIQNGKKLNFLHSKLPDLNLRVFGFLHNEPEPEYELETVKKIFLAKTLDETIVVLKEFNLNCTCVKLSEPDPKPYHSLYQLLNKLLAPILKPDISNFMENYFSWIYFKNSSIELSGSDVELSDIKAEGFKERMLTILQEEPKLFQEGEEALQSMLTIRNLIDLLQKIEEVIKGLSIMSQSSVFFRDIGNYKKDDFYENIFALIIGLNDNSNELLAFLATNLIRSVIQFGPGSDKKYEIQNRSLLINKKPSLLNKIVESLAYKTLFGSKNQESHYSLSLKATLQIFESLFISHRDSTSPEDLIYIYKVLTSKIVIAATSNICRCESYSLLYKSTVIFNHLFKISLAIKSSFKDLQALFMNNTCLILLHMFHGLSNVSCTQRKESMLFFSYMLSENQTACSLLIRLVPKCLLSRISTSQSDISKWGLPHWEEFFGVLSQNFNTPTEQWNDACRKELLSKVKNADEGFFRKRRDITEKEITLNNNDINIPESKLLSLKWNYEEFSIEYEALRPKFLVWKYYLSCLIRDKENPIITIAISQPLRLWNELNTSFISSLDELEKEKILKTLILLYRFHYHHIREINAIPYWVHLLRFEENEILRYLILQLLFCSFTREENTVNKLNIKRLFESYGIEVFFELLSGLHYIPDPNDPILDTPIHNFTQADFIKAPAESITSLKTNIIHFILNMFRILLNKQKPLDELDREVFPHPFIKTSCLQELHLEIIINTLLIPNEEINLLVLQILKEFFLDRISYQSLLQSRAFFEILLSKINEKTIKAVMEIVIILYERVCEDPELPNYIEVFLNFDFEALDPQIIEESLGFFRFLKFFPKNLIWRLFNQGFEEFQRIFFQESFEEPNLIWTSPMREKVFHLIHNHLEAYKFSLLDYSQEKSRFRLERLPRFQNWVIGEILHENIEKEVRCGPLFLRVWNLKSQKHFYIEEDMINRFLVLLGENLGVLVLNKTEEEFKNSVQPEDLLILLHSHSKAIKRYEIHQYTSFDEVIYILNYFSYVYGIPKKEESPTNMKLIKVIKFLNHGLRLVYRAIRIPNSGNLENFLQTKGFDAVFNTLQALVSKCFLQKKTPEYLYYYKNMDITAKDLGSLCLSLKILRFLLQNARLEIIELDPSRMFELCHLLQKVSKVPLVYFEFLKCRKRKKNIDSWEKVVPKGSEDKNLFEELNFDQEDIKNEYNPMEFYEKKIFFLMNDLAMLWVSFSTDVALLDSLIRAGVPWRCLEFAMLYEENFEMGGFDYEKTQRINEICEDCVLILRNLTIFAHEVFILKNTSFCEAPGLLLEKVVMAKQRSELLFNEISRLNKKKKDILKAYFEGLQTILMRKSVGNLLEDYYEALEKPEEKDKRGIKKFLKLFNKDCEEEMFIWTQENREDLKEVLKIQLSMINEDSNK